MSSNTLLPEVNRGTWRRPTISSFLLCLLLGPAGAQNILNNSGFETGLMCYTYYTWSVTGQAFAGDYTFSLSSSSHSGNYAFQIACKPGGTDCNRAALISNMIPVPPGGQNYTIGAWAKCAPGASPFFYIAENNQNAPLSCTGDWAYSTMNFSATSPFSFYVFDQGAQTLLIDDISLTYVDGTAPPHVALHPGVRSVNISGQNVMVDGSPYLALGFFDVPWSDISAVQATGANTVHGLSPAVGNPADCFNYGTKSYEDTIYEAGMNFVPDSTSTARMFNPSVFPVVTQTYAPHLANIAWFLADEADLIQVPVFGYVDPTTFVAEGNGARTGTTLPLFADMQHATYDTAAYEAPYAPGIDFWMAEPYGDAFNDLQYATSLLTSVASRPIWLAQDMVDTPLIVPKAYWAIVNGATGIFYFTWPDFQGNPPALAAATQAFSELTSLQGAIFGAAFDSLVTPPSGITTMSRYSQGTAYIMAVNPNPQTVQGTFAVQGLPAGQQITVLFEGRTLTSTAGGFSDSFAGVARHVYSITSPNVTLSLSSSANPATYGQPVTITANVNPALGAGPYVGTVTFTEGTNVLGQVPLSGGSASFSTSSLGIGTQVITASFASAGGFAAGSGSITFAVCGTAVLSISKSHTGNFSQGQAGAVYTVSVSNSSTGHATNGAVTVTENIPAGLTLVSMSGAGWTCASGGNTCTRSDALAPGAGYPPITVTVNVAGNASSPVTNQVSVSGGQSSAATANDTTVIAAAPVLSIAKSHTGSFMQGQSGAAYSVTVSNAGAGPSSGAVTVTENVPSGLALASMSGTGWTCANGGNTCTRNDALAGGASYPAIAVNVNVASNASESLTNQVTVAGGGSPSASASDVTNINPISYTNFASADLQTQGNWKGVYGGDGVAIAGDLNSYPSYAQVTMTGQSLYTWVNSTTDVRALQRIESMNRIAATWYASQSFSIDVNLTDGNAHQVALYCLDWDSLGRAEQIQLVDAATGNVLDTRNISGFQSGEYLVWNVKGHVTFNVTETSGNAVVNGIFFGSGANVGAPTLTVSSSHQGNFAQGQANATYTVSVKNSGVATTSGTVTVTENVPAGLTLVSMSGTGWTCPSGGNTCTNSAALGGGLCYSPITVSVNVAANAPASLTNQVTVSGGGAATATASDPTTVSSTVGVSSSASFLKADTSTEGSWKGVYGSDGSAIAGDMTNYPSYAQVTMTGPNEYTWAASTTAAQALQKSAASDRIASAWYSNNPFSIDVNLTDGNPHQVALYCLDWDSLGPRVEQIQVVDQATGNVLDTRNISNFQLGEYLVWNISGHVTFNVSFTIGNAVVSGVFFGGGIASSVPTLNISKSHNGNFAQGQVNATYSVVVSNASGAGATNGTVTVTENMPAGLTLTSMSGTGWTCPSGGNTCTNTAQLSGGSSYPPITVMANVAANASGPVTNQVSVSGGGSATAMATDITSITAIGTGSSLTFVKADTATAGNWKGAYGADGSAIAGDATNYPTYAQVSMTGENLFVWNSSTSANQALQKSAASDRIAAAWYSNTNFSIDVNLTDGNIHPVALYFLDWDGYGPRVEQIQVMDAASGKVLDTRAISSFQWGQYLEWNISGHVTFNVSFTAGNAVVSGIFFGGGGATGSPALSVTECHSGNFSQGQSNAAYSVTVSNAAGAGATNGTVTVTENIPSGLTLVSMSGTGWICPSGGNTCTNSTPLSGGSGYAPIAVAVNVASNAPASLTNQVTVAGGGSATATATDLTTIVSSPSLSIASSHAGSFTQGQSNATYSITVSNASGAGPTSGTVTVTETLPTGLSLVSMSGAGWNCPAGGSTCTNGTALSGGSGYAPITVTVNVASNAPSSLTNSVSVSGGGSSTAAATDPTTIIPLPVLAIASTHSGSFTQGQSNAVYSVTVSNASGDGPTNGTVTVTETLPTGLSLVSMSGAGWNCPAGGSTCTNGTALSGGSAYASITVTVNVASNAPSSLINSVSVSGGGSSTATATDPTTIIPLPVLSITSKQSGSFTQGQSNATYSITVSNASGAGPTSGTVTVTEILPTGLSLVSMSGTGWNCPAGGSACTNGTALSGGSAYAPITVTVNVALTAPASVVNQVSVSGGGSAPASSSDATTINPALQLSTVAFLKTDLTTQGTWKSAYGVDGAAVAGDVTNYPAYAQVTMSGQNQYIWNSSTSDVRALQKALGSDRIAATWYSTASFSIDVNLTDGNTHQLALYCLDWDSYGPRVETITVVDSVTGYVYDTRKLSGFQSGEYLVWNLKGHVRFNVTYSAGNAVVNGIFFGAGAPVGASALTIASTHAGTFNQGQSNATYSLTVANAAGAGATSGAVAVTDTLPAGLTLVSMSGSGWTCQSGSSSCTNSAPLAGGSSYPPITVTVSVAANAPSSVVNQVRVSGGGSAAASGSDATTITPAGVTSVATFLRTDVTTQGTWKGVYGADGSAVAGDAITYPSYAQVTMNGQSEWTWASSTSDVRALQKSTSGRIASAFYSGTTFSIDVNLADGNTHQVALYCMDWDSYGPRVQQVQVVDAGTGTVLDTRNLTAFQAGEYLVWNLKGHVTFKLSYTTGNAIVNGLFFR